MQGGKPRFYILDLVRGLAVFLMLLAHSVYFFHTRDNHFLLSLETIGNTFCFVAFLIVSGATTYVSYLSRPDDESSRKRLNKRILILLVSYYLIALFVVSGDIISANGLDKLKVIFEVLLLRNLPSYTEYIIPFIVYPWLISLAKVFFAKNSQKFYIILFWSVIFYLFGMLLYHLPLPAYLLPWKALLAGSDGYYRFPILQYSPVYLLGLYWGSGLLNRQSLKAKSRFVLNISAIALGLMLLIFYLGHFMGWDWTVLTKRWPPTVFFLLLSATLTFVFAYLFYASRRLNQVPILRDFLLIIGQNAFAFFWAHIFLLTAYKMIGGMQVGSVFVFTVMFIVFWLLCFALAIVLPFNLKFALTFVKYSEEEAEEYWEKSKLVKFEEEVVASGREEGKRFSRYFFPAYNGSRVRRKLIRKRHLVLGLSIGLIVAVLASPLVLDEAKIIVRNRQTLTWWDDSYATRQNFTVVNHNLFSNLLPNQTLEISFDHQKLVQQKTAKNDGSDIRLLYFSGSGYSLVTYQLQNAWDKSDTTLSFQLKEQIAGGKQDANYYLYFGNYLAESNQTDFAANAPSIEYKINWGEITTQALSLSIDKRWYLIGDKSNDGYADITVKPNVATGGGIVNYQVLNTSIGGVLQNRDGVFSARIPISTLTPGNYQIQAKVMEGNNSYVSEKEAFFVSYPLYVAWTIDWEGYDASDTYLKALSDISNRYSIPMTHFYNPRTTITTTISEERRAYLVSWLKDCLAKGDDMALHLHMFDDLLVAAGVVPKTEPRWDGGTDGYNVPITAYSTDELKQIIGRALIEMDNTGLPRPDIFRAGAWFANEQTLETVSEMGFVADSSGRTAYKFGSNQMPGTWNLSATTQPYRPSQSDQNTGSINNSLNILEIPDNGADSYWFSAADMISRFQANFQGLALKQLTQVTFLSHPHWFKAAEQQKVKSLLDYISQYRYDDDRGPVVFATSDQIYQAWIGR